MPDDLTCVTQSSAKSVEMEFWLSDVEQLGEDDNEWCFTVYGNKDIFLTTFVHPGKESAEAAWQAIIPALADAVYIATEES